MAYEDPMIAPSYCKNIMVDEDPAFLDILDTSPDDDWEISDKYTQAGEGFIFVYSITSRASFDGLTDVCKRFMRDTEGSDLQ